jgi:nitroreductase
MSKAAVTSWPLHELIAERWSPRAFDPRPVSVESLGSLFEAARWAPSSFNEQPWRFLVARREEGRRFERLRELLVPTNELWASKAPVLGMSLAVLRFARNQKPNRHALHDVGLAMGALLVEAQALGLSVHQMGGFDLERARSSFGLPEDIEPVAMFALGYRGDAASLPAELGERERAPRQRKPLGELVYGEGLGRAYEGLGPRG